MSGTIDRTPCPQCKMINNLYINIEFVAKPLGTWSLAGAQMKTTGRMLPVLKCRNCDFSLVGDFDGDSHAVFSPPKEDNSAARNTEDAPAT